MCKRAEHCMHGVICFILIDLIMEHDYFQKRKTNQPFERKCKSKTFANMLL